MKTNKIVLFIVIAVVAVGFAATFMTSNSKSQNKPAQSKQDEEIPIVDIYAPEPDEPHSKELQQNRSKKYDNAMALLEDVFEPDANLTQLPTTHAPAENALPVEQSQLVMIGTVTNSKAFLSTDKTNVYSEFTLRLERALKNSSPMELVFGSEIITEREGGRVRFSSGNILRRDTFERGFPQKGSRYLLFLKWSETGKDFLILTGYKLQSGSITPLDGKGLPIRSTKIMPRTRANPRVSL